MQVNSACQSINPPVLISPQGDSISASSPALRGDTETARLQGRSYKKTKGELPLPQLTQPCGNGTPKPQYSAVKNIPKKIRVKIRFAHSSDANAAALHPRQSEIPPSSNMQRVALNIEQRIKLRKRQIEGMSHIHNLSEENTAQLARYIEETIEPKNSCGLSKKPLEPYMLKKNSQNRLAKSLVIDQVREKIFVLLKKSGPLARKMGSFKSVTASIMLPYSAIIPAELVAQKVSRDNLLEKDKQLFLREINILKQLNLPQVQIYSDLKYTTEKNNFPLHKISCFEPLYTDVFGNFPKSILNSIEFIIAVRKILEFTHGLHQKGYIHGDIKLDNMLWKRDEKTGEIDAALTDFGFTFDTKNESPIGSIPFGYYGSIWGTAPELFGQPEKNIDIFKAECWALGFALFQCAAGHPPNSHSFVYQVFKKGKHEQWGKPTKLEIAAYKNIINMFIAREKERLEKNHDDSSFSQAVVALSLKLMTSNPNDRLGLKKAISLLKGIEENFLKSSH